jgi:hypothetical protein
MLKPLRQPEARQQYGPASLCSGLEGVRCHRARNDYAIEATYTSLWML